MATLVFATYIFLFLVVGAVVTETVIPKMTRRNCNDSDKGLWIR
jgi:hypothetical protein